MRVFQQWIACLLEILPIMGRVKLRWMKRNRINIMKTMKKMVLFIVMRNHIKVLRVKMVKMKKDLKLKRHQSRFLNHLRITQTCAPRNFQVKKRERSIFI